MINQDTIAARVADLEAENAALRQRVLPEGWRAVPVELTNEMMDAAEGCNDNWPNTTWKKAYAAMLAAAPLPPAAAPAVPGELTDRQIDEIAEEHTTGEWLNPAAMRDFARDVLKAAASAPEIQPADERALFEAWAKRTNTRPGTSFRQSYNSVYTDNRIAAKWAAFQAGYRAASAPVPAAQDGWKPNTGVQPVGKFDRVEVMLRDGSGEVAPAGLFVWSIDGAKDDITYWRPAAPVSTEADHG